MKSNQLLISELFLFVLLFSTCYQEAYSQNTAHPLSFQANKSSYSDAHAEYYYRIQEHTNGYRLATNKDQLIFEEVYDTIVKNNFFIKMVKGDKITIYRSESLEKIEIPNLKQAYFESNGLDVLTNLGAHYYDNSITKISTFPKSDNLNCGTVFFENYRLKYAEKSGKHSIEIAQGYSGDMLDETILEFNGIPENIDSIRFLSGILYTSESVNSLYNTYPNRLKIKKEGKSGIYSYAVDEAIYHTKEKTKAKEKSDYDTSIINGDTIFVPVDIIPIEISLTKKGSVTLKQVLPFVYNDIQQNTKDGLVYLYKDGKVGIYPNYTTTPFDDLHAKTTSFYKICKNGKQGWLDIKIFKEYYFE
jgi:hypothetical protein